VKPSTFLNEQFAHWALLRCFLHNHCWVSKKNLLAKKTSSDIEKAATKLKVLKVLATYHDM